MSLIPTDHALFDALFAQAAALYELSPKLMKAQAIAESRLNPFATSPAGACGLTQFMPKTWAEIMGDNASPFCPRHAIEAQGRYLRRLVKMVGTEDLDAVLAAYNWGPSRVKKHLATHDGVIDHEYLPGETRRYIANIKHIMTELEDLDAADAE